MTSHDQTPSVERYRQRTCKWCRRAVRWDTWTQRTIEIIGDDLHGPNCPRRAEYFKAEAYRVAEVKRSKR